MGWSSALSKATQVYSAFERPAFNPMAVDPNKIVSLDFETYYDNDYTLRKQSTSEYIRDERFEAIMLRLKVGKKKARVIPGPEIAAALAEIDWTTHAVLAHHTQFDAMILTHHYGVIPAFYLCTLSMARALYSNEIGAGLHEVSIFCGGAGKIKDNGALMMGKHFVDLWTDKALWKSSVEYCARDGEECDRVFWHMLPMIPEEEMHLINMTVRCFVEPVLYIDRPEMEAIRADEIEARHKLFLRIGTGWSMDTHIAKKIIDGRSDDEIVQHARSVLGSNVKFAAALQAHGVEPPTKISPTWIKKRGTPLQDDANKYTYAFAKTDLKFTALGREHPDPKVRDLVEGRLLVKSSITETRAGRLLAATENGWALPVYYKYAAAHTLRWGGGDKRNMQNLKRGSRMRKAIKAPPGYQLGVVDSGQIEARVNGWLWGQDDLIEGFRLQDKGLDRDVYCKFADTAYGRQITKADKDERFVGKVAVLALGYQMGPDRLQNTLALGTMGPAVHLSIEECRRIVTAYRKQNWKIKRGWKICEGIIEDMAAGRQGAYGPISWEKNKLWLPNGMCLHYPELHDKNLSKRVARQLGSDDGDEEVWAEWVYMRKGEETKIYGGLLDENIVQALARIIVGMQALEISKRTRIALLTHDEVVSLLPNSKAAQLHAWMLKVMKTSLEWCKDLPLFAEGGYAPEYSK